MSPLAANGGSEWTTLWGVFIIDSLVGMRWNTANPDEPRGAWWWDESLLPATYTDRVQIPGGASDWGDLDGDGIDDLIVSGVPASNPDGTTAGFIAPGPVSAFQHPVVDQPGLLPYPPWPSIPDGGLASIIPHCGDLNGDGIEERCSTMQVEFGPYEGTSPDWQRDFIATDEHGFTADLDGDGVNELYVSYQNSLERFIFTPTGPQPAVFEGINSLYWSMDLDGDGTDEIYSSGPTGVVRITDEDFLANTVQQTAFAGRHPYYLFSGDFDGDGELEVMMDEAAGTFVYETDGTRVLRIEPTGPNGDFGEMVDIGDADGNGMDDLVIGIPVDGVAYYVCNPLDCLP